MHRTMKVRRTIEIPEDVYHELEARAVRGAMNALILRYIAEGITRDQGLGRDVGYASSLAIGS